jgi:hypothetical protein
MYSACAAAVIAACGPRPSAPEPVHLPVNGLHSIGKKQDRADGFSLTLKIEGVKTESFFDIF